MCKDENSADSDVCFGDIWAAAQRGRSYRRRTRSSRECGEWCRPEAPASNSNAPTSCRRIRARRLGRRCPATI